MRLVPDSLPGMEEGGSAFVYEEARPEGIDAETFKLNVESATGGRVEVDTASGVLRARGALADYDRTTMLLAIIKTPVWAKASDDGHAWR